MRRGGRPVAIVALAVSLLLHAALLGGPAWQQFPATLIETPPLQARLVSTPARPVVPPPVPPTPSRTAPPSRVTPVPVPVVASPSDATAATAGAEVAAAADADAATTTPQPLPENPAAPEPAPNPLPPRLEMRYTVHYGVVSGEQTLVWVNDGARYTLTSVASATGIAGLFYRGQFVQTSRGRMGAKGLVPEEFWDQRGDRLSRARFEGGRVNWVPAKGEPRHFAYEGEAQDALSLFFQLALMPPQDGRVAYRVFNGKKLRDYVYAVRGEEVLETALGALRTVHLVRVDADEGRFEAWLALDRHALPVRVLRGDDDGRTVELRIRSIAP